MDEDHGLDGRCLKLEVDVATLAHLKGRQFKDGVVLPSLDDLRLCFFVANAAEK